MPYEFLDIHAHAYLWPCPPQDGRAQFCTPEDLLSRYDAMGVGCAVLLPLIGPEVYLPQSNEEILEICRRHPDRFIPFCNIDPRGIGNREDTDFAPWLSWYKEHGCRGVGEFMPNLPFGHPLVRNFFHQVEAMGWPLTFDTSDRIGGDYGLFDEPGLPQLENCLRAFPGLVLLGHGPEFWAEIGVLETPADRHGYPDYPVKKEGVTPKLFRRYPNLWGDLSAGSGFNALARDPAYAANFLDEFQDRLCFGTDLCSPDGSLPLADWLRRLRDDGILSAAAFRKIARGNAERLLGL